VRLSLRIKDRIGPVTRVKKKKKKCGSESRKRRSSSTGGTWDYLRLIDSCITQRKAEGPSRTCNESKEGKKGTWDAMWKPTPLFAPVTTATGPGITIAGIIVLSV